MSPKDTPLHIAIIPDGNRRWAKAQKLSPWKGHEKSARNFRDIITWCSKNPRISTLTIWCFSTENWKRDAAEVEKLMEMLEEYLKEERPTFHTNRMRLVHSGRTDRFTERLRNLLQTMQEETKDYDAFTLHLAIDYGGKDELLRAMHKLKDTSAVTEEQLRTQLDQPDLPDLDLIIRTSGEQRTSNFFLWQSAYAEWVFHPKLFPDFTEQDLSVCLEDFAKRTRRFGS
ncbi:di-trans,poly-cis-decaprenylcistransferase [Candidatus Peregrinibacteria bacterium CG10_big_fil_rev_8_21_14_0_10_49_24]|nr:MAG: di-trans,poly-cis-decaprenylcistransferase [Candidatus Peregrinibacteria bacterium CG11_big_fil_rev_8_21_14_0_20_49_14]PIR51198.1 MAG: di-trans,poly-cis-decaprenylcistransferase [Candidatus Peregrinibacteria bacterium CG10_big_fil_rev_8_21_14_0_10_49_24]PJA67237.1 MAG: di-trans,poly-cis-decaprenylcistransferase [Candidatus Peregrinibacteria bacterium CG_4_9_14_3_um_filter_49_12]